MVDELRAILEQFPDNPHVADRVGLVFGSALDKTDVQFEIYHAFLARWNGTLPQVLEYAPGGQCRLNYQSDGYCLWRIAALLFGRYDHTGQLEKGKNIAPKVAAMSQAIADSLNTCTAENGWLIRKAAELRDICNKSIQKSE
jgi:hypothetical protein